MNCAPSCMVYVTTLDGHPITPAQAKKISGTNKYGTNPKPFLYGWKSLGYDATFETDWNWEKLGAYVDDYYQLIQWWSPFYRYGEETLPAGHWSVVRRVLPDRAVLYDPDFSREVTYPRQTIEALWFDYQDDGENSTDFVRSVLLVRKPVSPIVRSLYAMKNIR